MQKTAKPTVTKGHRNPGYLGGLVGTFGGRGGAGLLANHPHPCWHFSSVPSNRAQTFFEPQAPGPEEEMQMPLP